MLFGKDLMQGKKQWEHCSITLIITHRMISSGSPDKTDHVIPNRMMVIRRYPPSDLVSVVFSADCSFFGQSFSLGHYPPIDQPPKGVCLLIIQTYIMASIRNCGGCSNENVTLK